MEFNFFRDTAFLRPTSGNPRDSLTDGVVLCLAEMGLADLSMAALAARLRVTPSAVVQRAGGRRRFIEIVVARFMLRWTDWAAVSASEDLPIRLPNDEVELHACRVRAALIELARGEALAGRPEALDLVTAAIERERDRLHLTLRVRLGRALTQTELDESWALADGVRAAMAAPARPLDRDLAAAILRRHLRDVLGDGRPAG